MNNKIQLEQTLQKIDELRLMVEKHFDSPQNIPSIESALVMEKLQFAYDVYFKMANQAIPTAADEQNESIVEGKSEDVFVAPQIENTIEEIEEAARESVITTSEEEELVLAVEKEVELFVENPPEAIDE
ncbi:MAG: hypothetical protein GXO89_13940, partial [Chlorobi bacterium]|nr:hypothetical protein [Chlorobiota bacterium]